MLSTPFHLMFKPSSFHCNIKCEYCFYLEKENLFHPTVTNAANVNNGCNSDSFQASNKSQHLGQGNLAQASNETTNIPQANPDQLVTKQPDYALENNAETQDSRSSKEFMNLADVENYIQNYIQASPSKRVDFTWQGGEPTLLGVDFFSQVVALQQKHANGKTITNALQSNGIAFNHKWMQLFKEHNFLIGLSIDGDAAIHDKYRISVNGKPTYEKVKKAITLLQEYGIEFNTLTVVNDVNYDKGLQVYKTLKELGVTHMQFIPCVEIKNYKPYTSPCSSSPTQPKAKDLATGTMLDLDWYNPPKDYQLAPFSVPAEGYGRFLLDIFNYWIKHDIGTIFVREFENLLGQWLGYPSANCVFRETCGTDLVIEANGNVYSCDHFVYAGYELGNVHYDSLPSLVETNLQTFAKLKKENLTSLCQQCEVRQLCHGGCPKHRIVSITEESFKHNYLCPSYKRFFKETIPVMNQLRTLSAAGYDLNLIKQYV